MRATIGLRDVVGITEDVFLIGIVPLHAKLHRHIVAFGAYVHGLAMQRRLVAVKVLDKRGDSTLILEGIFLIGALVQERDAYPGVEEGKLTQALSQDVISYNFV